MRRIWKIFWAQGETLVRSGKEYRWKAHDSLTVCGNKWFRHSQSKGGFPVDFVMEFYGKSFPEAVQMLTGETGEAQPEADPAPSPAFRLPLRNVTNANILNYLTQKRKLSPSLVNFFIAAGDIYEDAAHHNVVFVGRDADGHPHYASSRGIREKFRQDAAGAEKAFGFAHRGTDKQLLVFEAPIDLLSFIELFPKNWQQHNYLSLGGVSGKALRQFLSERPDVERVFLCLDADKAGEDACKRLAALLPDTVSVTRIQPCMKDWNDVLVHRAEIPNRNYFKSIVLKEPSKPETVKIIRETASADSMPEGVERQGIGTPATRAATIEKLVQKGFLERKGTKKTKVLLPTDKGKALITVMPEEIQSPEMTADWETKLLQIERGEMEPSEFMTEINTMITELVKNTEMKKGANALMKNKIIGVCPNCGARCCGA